MIGARRQLYYESLSLFDHADDPSSVANRKLLELLEFHFFIHCLGHVFSLATKWGIQPWSSKDILEAVHITLKSCSNSSYALRDQVDEFIQTRTVAFSCRPDAATLDHRCRVWRLLIKDATLIELLEATGFWYHAE